ncbi:hypothetical protein [Halorussus halophilus]|uniref:hypothetical protein n=1 Tax=Halorussus halophilus TaxID=2650975 RepID=UPI0013010496|nr:hypothetical protein [Halorussus halophilus]
MAARAGNDAESLAHCYGKRVLPTSLRPSVQYRSPRELFVAYSPVHFANGDMRRDYGWTRALLTALATAGVVTLGIRAFATALFVALFTTDLRFVVFFNVCVTLLVSRLLLATTTIWASVRPRFGLQRGWHRPITAPIRRRWKQWTTADERL